MEDDLCKVRVEEHMRIKIGEAKNIQCRNLNDIYCTLSLDQETIFRTSTVEQNSSSVFFGEEFQFEVPRQFRFLSVYVYGRDKHLKPDKVLGKVAIKRDDLKTYNNNKDYWFTINPVDADSEVQGKANVEMHFESNQLVVRVLECSDLRVRNGNCDPYAQVTCLYKNGKKLTKRTKCRRKTTCPQFSDIFVFENNFENRLNSKDSYLVYPKFEAALIEVLVSIWHSPGMSDDVFLGEVRISLCEQFEKSAWYLLQPRLSKNKDTKSNGLTTTGTRLSSGNSSYGSIRLKIQYTTDHVFPSHVYEVLRNNILKSVDTHPVSISTVYILSNIVPNNIEVAEPLVRIFIHYNHIVQMIRSLAKLEIAKLTDPTTIFRGNTLVSKMMDETMRLSGLHYLHKTLKPTIELICNERRPCEIDPARVKDSNAIQTNLSNLKNYIELIFNAITESAVHCPTLMCEIFQNLKELSLQYFPEHNEVSYSVISGFIFLRFFAPAILGPRLFDLTSKQIDNQLNRTLTLISKTIQSLGNLVSVKSSMTGASQNVSSMVRCKETYMECVWRAFNTDQHLHAVKHFLEIISTSSTSQNNCSTFEIPIVLKEGYLVKRAQGRRRFGFKNFKHRYFRLTTYDFSYAKTKTKKPLCSIALSNILAVEKLAEQSFKMKNMFQIVQPERALYIQASNCVEEKEWVDILSKICHSNSNRLDKYHPYAFRNNKWSCCGSLTVDSPGCTSVTSPDNRHLIFDPERDLQRIHNLLLFNIGKLEKLGHNTDFSQLQIVNESEHNMYLRNLSNLKEIVYNLEHKHRVYQRFQLRNVKYGSKSAPIGDDNYLHLSLKINL